MSRLEFGPGLLHLSELVICQAGEAAKHVDFSRADLLPVTMRATSINAAAAAAAIGAADSRAGNFGTQQPPAHGRVSALRHDC